MIDQDKHRSCNKPCIANVDGQCAAEDCGGAIVQMYMGQNRTLEISARYYQYNTPVSPPRRRHRG